jgi:hypothetical protein
MKLARRDAQVRRLMTVPGVGPITALAFKATIDEPPASPYATMGGVHPTAERTFVRCRARGSTSCHAIVRRCWLNGSGLFVFGGLIPA